jgi:hypothetical protein
MVLLTRLSTASILLLSTLVLSDAGEIRAATVLWTGNATNVFNVAGDWSGVDTPPLSGDSLTFGAAGTSGLLLNNDLTSSLSDFVAQVKGIG